MHAIEQSLRRLYTSWSGKNVQSILPIAQSGSDRKYFRLADEDGQTAIGTYCENESENRAFIAMTQHFLTKQLPVPSLLATKLEENIYLQEDLSDCALYQKIPAQGQPFSDELKNTYREVVTALARFQIQGNKGFDYAICYPLAEFGHRSMLWDLHYFKNFFLKLADIPFDEQGLEDDFEQLITFLLQADCDYFMLRDCQSRNIMLKENKPYFIDYQGGRRGALQYDLASLLFQAKGNMPHSIREELLETYLDAAEQLTGIDRKIFTKHYYAYVLIRCLQAMGAYGFRGLYEKKEHFVTSIPFAIKNIAWWLDNVQLPFEMPHLRRALELTVLSKSRFEPYDKNLGKNSKLTVKIVSFSYKKGLPQDDSPNGGGFQFDCRAIENPGRYEQYKSLTGMDAPVIQFLEQQKTMTAFLQNSFAIIDASVENYIERNFESLLVCFGCTGGQHRSVYSAEKLYAHLRNKYGINVQLCHREQGVVR